METGEQLKETEIESKSPRVSENKKGRRTQKQNFDLMCLYLR